MLKVCAIKAHGFFWRILPTNLITQLQRGPHGNEQEVVAAYLEKVQHRSPWTAPNRCRPLIPSTSVTVQELYLECWGHRKTP
jgi:hypothetical protein